LDSSRHLRRIEIASASTGKSSQDRRGLLIRGTARLHGKLGKHNVHRRAATEPSEELIADKAYDAGHLRAFLQARGTLVVIPNKSNRVNPYPFDAAKYKTRNVIERSIGRIKDLRAIATRYDKTARNFLAGICLASVIIWWIN
jgi:transposase